MLQQELTEIGVRNSRSSAASGGNGGNRAALLEGHELVEVVNIGEHLRAALASASRTHRTDGNFVPFDSSASVG